MKRNHIFRTIISTLLCLMMVTPSLADVLTLPSGTKVIEEYAFYGDTSIDEVVLPEGIEEIGDYAFAESGLTKINLPSTLGEGSIADTAIDKNKDIEITAIEGTDAYEWALEHGHLHSSFDDFTFSDNDDGTCSIIKYTGNDPFVSIPSTNPDGKLVTRIGYEAFYGQGNVQEILYPDSITIIDDRWDTTIPRGDGVKRYAKSGSDTAYALSKSGFAFFDPSINYGIRYILGNYSLNIIGIAISQVDKDVVNFVCPEDVIYIDPCCFENCTDLKTVTLPSGLEVIRDNAFAGCRSLSEITIPETVYQINGNAFADCISLKEVFIPQNVFNIYGPIDDNPFLGCTSLEKIEVDEGNYRFSSQDGVLMDKNKTRIYAFPGGKRGTYRIPEGITQIGGAFPGCMISEIILPESVTGLYENAFKDCSLLTHIYIPNTVTSIGNNAFTGCCSLTEIAIPESIAFIGSSAFDKGGFLKRVYCVPDSYAWNWFANNGFDDKLVEWDGISDPNNNPNITHGQFVCFSTGSDFIGLNEEVASTKENGDIVSRIQYPLTPGMELSIPFRTDSDAVKATVKLRYWDEYYQNYYTYCVNGEEVAASTTQFQTDADGKTGVLKLTLPSGSEIRTDLYVLQLWSKNSQDTVVDARVKIKIKSDPWIGYVQADSVPTYEGPTGTTLKGRYVDNTDPVRVLDVEEYRYKIEMTTDTGNIDERWVDKDGIKETYMPWIGYVQEPSIPTYSSSTASSSNGHITDQYPVKVLMVEGARYRISVQNGDNSSTEIWVNKSKIEKTENKGEITGVSFTDAGRVLLIGNPYTLQIVGNAEFEKITITCTNCQSITITDPPEFSQGTGYVWQTWFWPPAVGGEALLIVKGYAGDVDIAEKTLTIYSAEEISASDRTEYCFTAESSNNRVWAIPDSSSEPMDTAELNSDIIVYGAYPSLRNLEYYYASYIGADGESHEGFVRNASHFIVNWLKVTEKMIYFTVTVPDGYCCEFREGYYENDNVVYPRPDAWKRVYFTGSESRNSYDHDGEDRESGSISHVEFRAYKEDYAGNKEYLEKNITRDVVVLKETYSINPSSTPKINLICSGLTKNAVRLSWTCGEIPNEGWRVYHSLDDNPQGSWDIVGDANKDNPHLIDPDVETGRMNYYYVEGRSKNSNNEIETSEIIAIYPIECPRLEIDAYKVMNRSDAVTISWGDIIPEGLKGEVYWAESSTAEYKLLKDNLTTQGGCLAEGMPSDGVLYFKLRFYREDTVNGKTIRSNSEWDTPVSVRMQAEGTFRSLIMVWEEFKDCEDRLFEFSTDKGTLEGLFSKATPEGLPWNSNESIAEKNLSVGEVYDNISAMSRLAHDNDITWVHIVTHGDPSTTTDHNSGALVIDKKHEDGSFTTNTLDLSVLAMWLNDIPGRVIVSLGSCGSGSATADAANIAFSEMDTTISVPNKLVYASDGYVGLFRQSKFVVFTGSLAGETAYSSIVDGSRILSEIQSGYNELKTKSAQGIVTLSDMKDYLDGKSGRTLIYAWGIGTESFTTYPAKRFFELFKPVVTQ